MTWWKDAVCYEIYIRSFADSDGDGIGDLEGIRRRLPYLRSLGVDAIWITPFYRSPMVDHGYDVADYRDVDPLFGSLASFDGLLAEAHDAGIRVIVDVVPNHTSDRHEWFQAAISSRDNEYRERYIFRDPAPGGGPPNNWVSVFGGPAWTLHSPTGQYYLHLFAPEQPDLNWRNPAVHDELSDVLRFWLDRGVDGFRIDVAHGLYKDEALRDNPQAPGAQRGAPVYQSLETRYNWDQEETHEVHRAWRRLADSYGGDRVLVGEVFLFDIERAARYVRPDELHLGFNFLFAATGWDAETFRRSIEATLAALDPMGATPTWLLSNHDLPRHVTRLGGMAQARAAVLFLLALPGTVFLYAGEELGLEQVDVPPAARRDPIAFRTGGLIPGRDGCRVPIPWDRGRHCGFSDAEPWLPMPEGWCERSVEAAEEDDSSILALYRRAIELRPRGGFRWLDAPDGILAFEREPGSACVCNFTGAPATIDVAGEIVLASGPGARVAGGPLALPPHTAVWLLV